MKVRVFLRSCMMLMGAFLLSLQVGAQRNYFVFIQADQKSPFYVRMGTETFSSTSSGHIILSGLTDSTYQFNIGFPRNQYPEQSFTVPLNKRDRGFELKNLPGQGWVLYDWQTMEFIRQPASTGSFSTSSGTAKNDSYSLLLAGVVDDSAVLYNIIIRNDTPAKAPNSLTSAPQPTSRDSGALTRNAASNADTISAAADVVESPTKPMPLPKDSLNSIVSTAPAGDSVVTKETAALQNLPADTLSSGTTSSEQTNAISGLRSTDWKIGEQILLNGTRLTYVDRSSASQDTVNIIIEQTLTDGATSPIAEVVETDSVQSPKIAIINSDCRKFASEADVDKLRVQMLREDGNRDRLKPAQKTFRTMCFTSKQIKALSELFDSDELKFQFLSASYPFVSDSSEFKNLIALLRDPKYIEEFKTMVRL